MGVAEIRLSRDHHTRVGDRLLKCCRMDVGIAVRVMGEGRQRDIHVVKGFQPGYGERLTSSLIEQADYRRTAPGENGCGRSGIVAITN